LRIFKKVKKKKKKERTAQVNPTARKRVGTKKREPGKRDRYRKTFGGG